MGRGRIEIKRIENTTSRQVTFSKRRGGLLKKAHELAVLCDAQIGVIVFSSSGKLFQYCSPATSMRQIIDRYLSASGTHLRHIDNQQIYGEITRMKDENEKLQASMRHLTGEDLSSMNINDLQQLEHQLQFSVDRVRARKNQLLHQQLENLRKKELLLQEENSSLSQKLHEQQAAMVMEHKVMEHQMMDQFGTFYQEDQHARNLFHGPSPDQTLNPFRLQPIQPNLQDLSLHHL